MAQIQCCCGCGIGLSCSSHSTPGPGTSTHCRCSCKKKKQANKNRSLQHNTIFTVRDFSAYYRTWRRGTHPAQLEGSGENIACLGSFQSAVMLNEVSKLSKMPCCVTSFFLIRESPLWHKMNPFLLGWENGQTLAFKAGQEGLLGSHGRPRSKPSKEAFKKMCGFRMDKHWDPTEHQWGLLGSTGNYVQSLGLEHDGRYYEEKKVCICVCVLNQLYFNKKRKGMGPDRPTPLLCRPPIILVREGLRGERTRGTLRRGECQGPNSLREQFIEPGFWARKGQGWWTRDQAAWSGTYTRGPLQQCLPGTILPQGERASPHLER